MPNSAGLLLSYCCTYSKKWEVSAVSFLFVTFIDASLVLLWLHQTKFAFNANLCPANTLYKLFFLTKLKVTKPTWLFWFVLLKLTACMLHHVRNLFVFCSFFKQLNGLWWGNQLQLLPVNQLITPAWRIHLVIQGFCICCIRVVWGHSL